MFRYDRDTNAEPHVMIKSKNTSINDWTKMARLRDVYPTRRALMTGDKAKILGMQTARNGSKVGKLAEAEPMDDNKQR